MFKKIIIEQRVFVRGIQSKLKLLITLVNNTIELIYANEKSLKEIGRFDSLLKELRESKALATDQLNILEKSSKMSSNVMLFLDAVLFKKKNLKEEKAIECLLEGVFGIYNIVYALELAEKNVINNGE